MSTAGPRPSDAADPPLPDRSPDPTRRVAALAILAAFLLPAAAAERGPVVCPVRHATGLPCPACGLTRSWRAALHGRPAESLRLHPLGIVSLGGAAAYAAGLDGRLAPATRDRLRRAWPIAVAGWTGIWLVRLGAATRHRRRESGGG